MWLELNVYHVQGQWVTYFRECSFIRLKIYYPQPPTSPRFFSSVCLGRCEAGAGLSFSLWLFWSGGRIFLPRVLNFGGHLRGNSYRSLDQLSQQARHSPSVVIWISELSAAASQTCFHPV